MEIQTQTGAGKPVASSNGASKSASSSASGGMAKNAVDLFLRRSKSHATTTALRFKEGGVWRELTWADWETAAREIAAGLRALGVKTGDRVCMLANTRWEWLACDVGILMAGAVTVPIYQSNLAEQCQYIINDSGAAAVIVEDPHQLDKLVSGDIWSTLTTVNKVIYFTERAKLERPDKHGRTELSLEQVVSKTHVAAPKVSSLDSLRAEGKAWLAGNPGVLEKAWDEMGPDHIFTIVYTSGTTGPPKGAVLTHHAITWECDALTTVLPISDSDEQLLFLPMAHIFAKILAWATIAHGGRIALAESVPQLAANLKELRPTYMGAVPRVYEKVYGRVKQKFSEEAPRKKKLIDWALAQGRAHSVATQAGRSLGLIGGIKYALANKLVLSKVRETFGGRIRFFVSGGAPLAAEIAEFFHSVGILVLEGYGLTETTAASFVNRLDNYKFGTVGPAIPGLEVKIATDGEVLIRGGSVLREYYKKPEATREAIDPEGWFHTGDIGVLENGMLRITDRKKDIIVTAGGKNVAPQNIENLLKTRTPLISQVMVHGDKRPFCCALVTLAEENLLPWAKTRGLEGDYAALTQHPAVKAEIDKFVAEANKDLAQYEKIKKYEILDRDLTQDAGDLTPTLKVKRKFVSEKYKAKLDAFYASGGGGAD
ncbi:MAG: long-chain fatty acid--CoA ligase [Deltaproteobacteria bacterium]|nr:long-chain fatty acid--CoA ligase [Deltaproteobacteria bacterium]